MVALQIWVECTNCCSDYQNHEVYWQMKPYGTLFQTSAPQIQNFCPPRDLHCDGGLPTVSINCRLMPVRFSQLNLTKLMIDCDSLSTLPLGLITIALRGSTQCPEKLMSQRTQIKNLALKYLIQNAVSDIFDARDGLPDKYYIYFCLTNIWI